MNNNELFNKFKKQVAIYNFEQEYKENKRTSEYPLKKDIKEWRKYFMKKKILQTVATLIVIFTFGMTVYAGVTGNLNFKNMGLLKVSENFEDKKVEVKKTIENDYVKIDYEKTKFQTLFNNGSLLITDYSSVAFDFAYLYKPVIYYQYGEDYHFNLEESYFDYETMGMGEVCKDEDELVDIIIYYIENQCKIKDKYSKRIDDFFLFNDKNNCKRVHEAIKRLPLKD